MGAPEHQGSASQVLGASTPQQKSRPGSLPTFPWGSGQKSGQEERAQDSLPPAQEGAQKVCFLVVMSLDRPKPGFFPPACVRRGSQ